MSSPRRHQGFTLIELLVVLTLIALLISVLLPRPGGCVGGQAKATLCLANLKGVATATMTYAADDPTEAALPVHALLNRGGDPNRSNNLTRALGAYGYGGKSGRGKEEGNSLFWATEFDKGPATRPLNTFIYKDAFVNYKSDPGVGQVNWRNDENLDLSLFRCPGDDGYRGAHWGSFRAGKLSSYDHYGTSYAANALWFADGDGLSKSASQFLRPVSRIPNPAATVAFIENVGRFAWTTGPQGGDHGCDGATGQVVDRTEVNGWHGNNTKFNAVFSDRHAATIAINGFDNPSLQAYPAQTTYDDWCAMTVRDPKGNWQLDALPAAPVVSDIPCDPTADEMPKPLGPDQG